MSSFDDMPIEGASADLKGGRVNDFVLYYQRYWKDKRYLDNAWETKSQHLYDKVRKGDNLWVVVNGGADSGEWRLLQRIIVNRKVRRPEGAGFKLQIIGFADQGEKYDIHVQKDFAPTIKKLEFDSDNKIIKSEGRRIGNSLQNRHKLNAVGGKRIREAAKSIALCKSFSSSERLADYQENDDLYNDVGAVLESYQEGSSVDKFVSTYERNPKLRMEAIRVHGVTCKACGFDFEETYGDYAAGLIHIHHLIPISEVGGLVDVCPETDLVPLCANCHAVVHRKKDKTLSLPELKALLKTR